MFTSKFIRWNGLALLLAGILVAISALLHPDEMADPSVVLGASWVPIHTVLLISIVLTAFGLVGLYLAHMEKGSIFGTIGFILSFVGIIITFAVLTVDSYIIPVLAADESTSVLLDPNSPLFTCPLGLEFLLAALTFSIGAVAFGIDIARANVLPRVAGILFVIGGSLMGFSGLLPHLVFVAGGVLMGASFAWMGYALWSDRTFVAKQIPSAASA